MFMPSANNKPGRFKTLPHESLLHVSDLRLYKIHQSDHVGLLRREDGFEPNEWYFRVVQLDQLCGLA
jgi:hypothetical protein